MIVGWFVGWQVFLFQGIVGAFVDICWFVGFVVTWDGLLVGLLVVMDSFAVVSHKVTSTAHTTWCRCVLMLFIHSFHCEWVNLSRFVLRFFDIVKTERRQDKMNEKITLSATFTMDYCVKVVHFSRLDDFSSLLISLKQSYLTLGPL